MAIEEIMASVFRLRTEMEAVYRSYRKERDDVRSPIYDSLDLWLLSAHY